MEVGEQPLLNAENRTKFKTNAKNIGNIQIFGLCD